MICDRVHSIKRTNTHRTIVFTRQAMRGAAMKQKIFNTPPPPPPPSH